MTTTAILWLRRDLRLHDNEALSEAAAADRLLPVYVVDPRTYGDRPYGGPDSFRFGKTGPHRARFRCEALSDLRASFRERGSELVVREGPPEEVLADLATTVDADVVAMHTRPAPEEARVESSVTARLRERGVRVRRLWGHTLYHVNDLPTPYTEVSDTYTSFRKSVEREASVREQVATPSLPPLPDAVGDAVGPGDVPTPATLPGLDDETVAAARAPDPDGRGVLPFEGGESAALDRVESYVWDADRLREYKETRNGLIGEGYSSKLSPWLNEGCLSPRYVHDEVRRYEELRVKNDSTYWLLFELIWRDFFQFQVAKHGGQFFSRPGIRERHDIDWRDDDRAFDLWAHGETGIPFVDANMRELNETGYMSNRGRQNAASFLANNLRIDWRRGAAYFETQLVDYEPCSNYGNWAYIAGVGNDSRDRYFNVVKQARQYDARAEYVTHWLPVLEPLPPEYAHEPWRLSADEQAAHGVELGVDYPEPMLDLDASYEKLR
ncbi:DASH family cryptochrome [Salinigranum marinum]|uniref:DASH family cryptochrome n=1 Tax=Salinigranum marinum TaxID=1515595 RepID=UPI00298A0160|nr:DASH family cryptochrome [Salinigranum marinum]